MTPDELANWIAQTPSKVLPLVGAGMTLPAGAPSADALAAALAHRLGLDDGVAAGGLPLVARRGKETHDVATVQEHLAEIMTGLRLRPTPALTALSGTHARRILTTNYDDGLERAAAARGIAATALLPTDPRMLEEPEPGQLHVIHLHGLPGEPDSLVLPGETTNALDDNDVFTTFVRATMALRSVLFLGFSFATTEVHLHHVVRWLSGKVRGAPTHQLLISSDEIANRPGDMEAIAAYGNVNVVAYTRDATHTAVERVALSLAPRVATAGGDRERLTWVQPPLLHVEPSEDAEALQRRTMAFDGGWGDPSDLRSPEHLLAERRSLVVAGPGMGKTTLLDRLGRGVDGATATAKLRHFHAAAGGVPRERAVHRLLMGSDGEPLALEVLRAGDAVLLLDGLDEVAAGEWEEAVGAIVTAAEVWPQHAWIISARPGERATALADAGFATYRIPVSRAWARTYLQTRSVPSDRIERAMLDGYGLGDLLSIPLFAERLADRLLDDLDAATGPLDLLVTEQYAATRREARRNGYPADELATWMRSLAVGLELRGRSAARIDELGSVPGPGSAADVQRALVEATLLADAPGSAEFPTKTLQEGLCADAILRCKDPVTVLREMALAEVDGHEWFRDDIDFMIDLVFEHADRATRERLRQIDSLRWARTVASRGTLADAREAFGILWDRHVGIGVRFGWGGESGLRSSRQAVAEIARRWPDVIDDRVPSLEVELASTEESARSRALFVLSLLRDDARVETWVCPRLNDGESRIVIEAAAAAGRLRLRAAHDRLLELLDHREENVRKAALQALVEIADQEELPAIAARARGNGLRRVAPRLLERLDLDTGLAVVATGIGIDETQAWLLDRLIETAHPDAWSAERVSRLMQCCDAVGGGGDPDLDRIAQALSEHPDAAISEVRLRPLDGQPHGSRLQLLALRRLGPELIAGDEHAGLRIAIERAIAEDAEIHARRNAHDHWRARLAAQLDEHGRDVEPHELEQPVTRRDIEDRHHDLLRGLVDRWWPDQLLDEADNDGWLPVETRVMLNVGAALEAPLPPNRWRQLLDAHVRARRLHHELSGDGVTSWLSSTYTDEYEPVVIASMAQASDGEALTKLIAVSGAGKSDAAITAAAIGRLRELGPESSWWLTAVGLLSERGALDEVRQLLDDDMPAPTRAGLLDRLAARGDGEAQLQVINDLTAAIEAGTTPERTHWWVRTRVDADALRTLADTAIRHNADEALKFAVGLLAECDEIDALRAVDALAQTHGEQRRGLHLQATSSARRIAKQRVLSRLPSDLAELVAHFETLRAA